jgi:ring-1,2-phenylacetyl-CoA epoxidase subunit PaaD
VVTGTTPTTPTLPTTPTTPTLPTVPAVPTVPTVPAVPAVPTLEAVAAIAGSVPDPEIPSLTIADLGILRAVRVDKAGHVEVDLTPTYSGCPAVEAIESDVREALVAAGWRDAAVRRVLAPAWTTDWITAEGRQKLTDVGIAPPGEACVGANGGPRRSSPQPAASVSISPVTVAVACPQCGSCDTELVSRFSSTACKALRRCRSCAEPFEHFKPL